jgi:hypothetical protein
MQRFDLAIGYFASHRAGAIATTLAAGMLLASSAAAHHSAVIFDTGTVMALEGTVRRFDWANPHVYLYVEAENAAGEPIEWKLESDSTSILTRSGWSAASVAAGDWVRIRANPHRSTDGHALLVSLARPDGTVLLPRSGAREPRRGATTLAGTWDGLRGTSLRQFNFGALTEKGAAAQVAYTEADSPVSECIAFPLPTIVASPYVFEIELGTDRILIRSELFNVERVVYMDGRGHPDNGERSNQGHSVGWWENDVLVVDTALFADNRNGNRNGIPSGANKHVVERYRLSEDGRHITIEFVVEDPEFLAEPMTGSIVWDHAPDLAFQPFGCDPEIAKRYTF